MGRHQPKQFKHIIFDSVHAFEYMTICRKSMMPGIAYHDIIYHSTIDGYEVSVFNMKVDATFNDLHPITDSSA